MKLSVVIPCLNEQKTIGICVDKAYKAIRELNLDGEVVVADNGSTDNSVKIADCSGARIVKVSQKGYGSACIDGLKAAEGEFLIVADADDSYNFEEIAPFIEKLEEGYDFVVGNRFKGNIQKGAMPFLHRYLGTPVLTWIMNLLFRTGIGDTNCGMRALTKDAFLKMHLKAGGMEFATEMIVKASVCKLKIAEVPCNLYKDKRGRKPHLSAWPDGWRHLRFMLLFASSWLFFLPGVVFLLAGLGGMIALLLRDIFIPEFLLPVFSQYHLLSSMLLFLLGAQIIGLGLAAEAFSYSRHFDISKKSITFLSRYFNLERGLLCGILLIIFSILSFSYLLFSYMGFLPFSITLLRFDLAVFASMFFILGIQFIYTSFLLSLFYLKVK